MVTPREFLEMLESEPERMTGRLKEAEHKAASETAKAAGAVMSGPGGRGQTRVIQGSDSSTLQVQGFGAKAKLLKIAACLLYTSPSPRDRS